MQIFSTTSGTTRELSTVGYKPTLTARPIVSTPSSGAVPVGSTPSIYNIPKENPVTVSESPIPDPIVPLGGNGNEPITAGATGPSGLTGLSGFFSPIGTAVHSLFTDTSVPTTPTATPDASSSTGTYLLIGAAIIGLWIVLK